MIYCWSHSTGHTKADTTSTSLPFWRLNKSIEICYILQMTAVQKLFHWLGPKSSELCFGSDEFGYKYLTKSFELVGQRAFLWSSEKQWQGLYLISSTACVACSK